MYTGVGFGIEFLFQFSPLPTPSAIGKMMPQGGFGDFKALLSNSFAGTGPSSDANEKRGGNETPVSFSSSRRNLNISPYEIFFVQPVPLSLSSVSVQTRIQSQFCLHPIKYYDIVL